MSNKYKHGEKVPSQVLANRMDELAQAVTKGKDAVNREFTMRVPAELDRDADLVLSAAAKRLIDLEQQTQELLAQNEELREAFKQRLITMTNEEVDTVFAKTPKQSLASIKSAVEEETIERCRNELEPIKNGLIWRTQTDILLARMPRKYQPTE